MVQGEEHNRGGGHNNYATDLTGGVDRSFIRYAGSATDNCHCFLMDSSMHNELASQQGHCPTPMYNTSKIRTRYPKYQRASLVYSLCSQVPEQMGTNVRSTVSCDIREEADKVF